MPKNLNRLKVLRAGHDKTQRDTAAEAGMSVARYWEIENGYRIPTDTERETLALIFGVTAADVFPEPQPLRAAR